MTVQQRDKTREGKQKKTLDIDINFSENKKKLYVSDLHFRYYKSYYFEG